MEYDWLLVDELAKHLGAHQGFLQHPYYKDWIGGDWKGMVYHNPQYFYEPMVPHWKVIGQ
jgi:hypothetical protein